MVDLIEDCRSFGCSGGRRSHGSISFRQHLLVHSSGPFLLVETVSGGFSCGESGGEEEKIKLKIENGSKAWDLGLGTWDLGGSSYSLGLGPNLFLFFYSFFLFLFFSFFFSPSISFNLVFIFLIHNYFFDYFWLCFSVFSLGVSVETVYLGWEEVRVDTCP